MQSVVRNSVVEGGKKFKSLTSTVLHTGLVEQWLVEGKLTEDEAISLSCDMLAAGIDTVSEWESIDACVIAIPSARKVCVCLK